jgi:antitoxin FitA
MSMPSITIRNVPPDARDELAARAARAGQSLQEFLRAELIELARRPDAEALVATVRARKLRTRTHLDADEILALRGADRR